MFPAGAVVFAAGVTGEAVDRAEPHTAAYADDWSLWIGPAVALGGVVVGLSGGHDDRAAGPTRGTTAGGEGRRDGGRGGAAR